MGFKFIGEGSAELQAWPEAERRRVYLQAVRRSYCRLRTWVGLVIALAVWIGAFYLAKAVLLKPADAWLDLLKILPELFMYGGLAILGVMQVSVIRKELRTMSQSRQPAAPVAESATPSPQG